MSKFGNGTVEEFSSGELVGRGYGFLYGHGSYKGDGKGFGQYFSRDAAKNIDNDIWLHSQALSYKENMNAHYVVW